MIAHPQVRIDVHREIDVAVPCQGLSDRGMHFGFTEVRDEGMPIGVEVGEEPVLVLVRHACPFQVEFHHLRRFAELAALRLECEERGVGVYVTLGGQPFPQPVHDHCVKRDAVESPPLAVARLHADSGRGAVQIQGTER